MHPKEYPGLIRLSQRIEYQFLVLQRFERIALFLKVRARDEESLPSLPETD